MRKLRSTLSTRIARGRTVPELVRSRRLVHRSFAKRLSTTWCPPRGVALQLGTNFFIPLLYINNGVLAGGDYPVQATVTDAPATAPVIRSRLVLYGVIPPACRWPQGTGKYDDCGAWKPPSRRNGEYEKEPAPQQTVPDDADRLPRPAALDDGGRLVGRTGPVGESEHGHAQRRGHARVADGLLEAQVPAGNQRRAGHTNASTSSGLTVNVHVPQTAALNPDGLAESSLRDTTVTLPEGVAINPSGGDGLEACTSEPARSRRARSAALAIRSATRARKN